MALQHLKDTGRRFTYDKYGWDVDEDNNFIENEKEQYWIDTSRCDIMRMTSQSLKLQEN
jgi:hypothetical protein